MCGICGIIPDDKEAPIERTLLAAMNESMRRRGPDGEGFHIERGVGIAMRRLAIIDVTHGRQPVASETEDVVAICNGEIYNYRELFLRLLKDGHQFRSQSDAEVLPHLYQVYGDEFIHHISGMFSLAIWDRRRRRLILARDRMGEKPLYWTHQHGVFLFASLLKTILVHPVVERRIDRQSLSKYLAYEYVPVPRSIFSGIQKLPPGHMLILEAGHISIRQYWDLPRNEEVHHISDEEAIVGFRERFEHSVKQRLISDVPLGVFLSGGIDSSSVVAAMTQLKPAAEIKTFSMGFEEASFDESVYARKVATLFGTDHREMVCRPEDLIARLPEVSELLDEPLGDGSIVPTLALSQFAREHVTVALGGDGGDECLAGYPTFQAEVGLRYYRGIPSWIRTLVLEPMARSLPISDENMSFDFKLKQFLKGVGAPDIRRHMIWIGSFAPEEQRELLSGGLDNDPFSEVDEYASRTREMSPGNQLLSAYMKLYLEGDILFKVDRASMYASLECRAPFLDHELVEYVARLPYHLKLRGFTMKYLLKRAYGDRLPRLIVQRPKKGFGIPAAKWFKGPLLTMARDYFSEERIVREGFFRPKVITGLLKDHLEGRADNRKKLWTLFIFERWLERWGSS